MNINLTLIAQLVAFVVFVWFTMKYVWPPMVKAMDERKARIADGLAAAERGVHEKELAEQRAKQTLYEAKQKYAEILARAESRAAEIIDEAKDQAKQEGARLVAAAQADIEQQASQVREALRQKLGELAVAGAEKILRKEINLDTHKEMIDALAAQL